MRAYLDSAATTQIVQQVLEILAKDDGIIEDMSACSRTMFIEVFGIEEEAGHYKVYIK